MNLAYVTRTALPASSAQSLQISKMARAFHALLGDQFRLVCAAGQEQPEYPWPFQIKQLRLGANLPGLARQLRFLPHSLSLAGRNQGSVLFTRDIALAFATVFAGGRAIYETHQPPSGRFAYRLTSWLAQRSGFGVVAISNALAQYYQHEFAIPDTRLIVAHDAVFADDHPMLDPVARTRLRRALGLPIDQYLLIHTGALHKGGAELFEQLRAPFGPNAHVIHIGGDPEQADHWQSHFLAMGANKVTIQPRQPHDIALAYQRAADALIYLNSRSSSIHRYTSPLKLFEYMASGRPILGARVGAVAEILDEQTGFCFDPDIPGSIRTAAVQLRDNTQDAERRAAQARAKVFAHHTWIARARAILELAQRIG